MATEIGHWITMTHDGGRRVEPVLAFSLSARDEARYPLLLCLAAVEMLAKDFEHINVMAILQYADGQANEEECPKECRPPWASDQFDADDILRLINVAHIEPKASSESLMLMCEGTCGTMRVPISAFAGDCLEKALNLYLEYTGNLP